jgi:hypothetical protein
VFARPYFDSGSIDGSLEQVLDGTNGSAAALSNFGVRESEGGHVQKV